MTTTIRANISNKNKYWISKHRHYELKHFCLQYPSWKQEYMSDEDISASVSNISRTEKSNSISDPTAKYAINREYYSKKIQLVEKAAKYADERLYEYILKAVTEGLSYTYLKNVLHIPCGKDLYYDRYRKFFWILDNLKG